MFNAFPTLLRTEHGTEVSLLQYPVPSVEPETSRGGCLPSSLHTEPPGISGRRLPVACVCAAQLGMVPPVSSGQGTRRRRLPPLYRAAACEYLPLFLSAPIVESVISPPAVWPDACGDLGS